jgi:hypothetical protein
MALVSNGHLALAQRHLGTADHCLVRQLHVLSRLGALGADLSLAESIFEAMLHNHTLLTELKELIERELNHETKPAESHDTARLKLDDEATALLSKLKLHNHKETEGCFIGF